MLLRCFVKKMAEKGPTMRASLRQRKATPRAGTATRIEAFDVAAAAGFACLLATLLVYSAAAMPFQRFAVLPSFVTSLGLGLRAGAVAGGAAAVLVVLGLDRLLRTAAARVVCAAAFVAGNALFCAMALGLAEPGLVADVTGVCIGVGCVGQVLAWGRVLAAYGLRSATGVVAAAAVIAALLGWVQLLVPEAVAVALFMAATVTAVFLAYRLNRSLQDGASTTNEPAAEPAARSRWNRIRAFLDIALIPAIGLALFAMLMAVRGELFFNDYSTYVTVQVAVAVLLLACMLLPARIPLMQAVYRGLIPLLACVVLFANYACETLLGGSPVEISLVLVLYTAAALLTLSTLAGMAHAAEFPVDLISSLAIALFCAVTVATQVTCASLEADASAVRTLVVLTSGIYATGMIVATIWRALRSEGMRRSDDYRGAGLGTDTLGKGAGLGMADGQGLGASDALNIASLTVDDRCDSLARTYGLTPREREILGYLARGYTSSYIGDELIISANTVRTHVHNIYRKLGVAARDDVLRLIQS